MHWDEIIDAEIRSGRFVFINTDGLSDLELMSRRILGIIFSKQGDRLDTELIFFEQISRIAGQHDAQDIKKAYAAALDWWTEVYTGKF